MTTSISIVFPMYNEEENIDQTISVTLDVINDITKDYEIIIVNDASTDKTKEIAEKYADENKKIKVIHHKKNLKLGASIKTGYEHATKDLILYSDADMPFDILELKKALRIFNIKKADIVSAYRLDRTSEGIRRTVYSFFYNLLIKIVFNVNIMDINFSFKLFKRSILNDVKLEADGSFIDAEFIIKCFKRKYHIVQFGTDYFVRTRGVSTLSRPGVILKILQELLKLKIKLILQPNK